MSNANLMASSTLSMHCVQIHMVIVRHIKSHTTVQIREFFDFWQKEEWKNKTPSYSRKYRFRRRKDFFLYSMKNKNHWDRECVFACVRHSCCFQNVHIVLRHLHWPTKSSQSTIQPTNRSNGVQTTLAFLVIVTTAVQQYILHEYIKKIHISMCARVYIVFPSLVFDFWPTLRFVCVHNARYYLFAVWSRFRC